VSRRALGVLLALAAAGLVLWLFPRRPKDPEAQIRKLVATCVAGVEARSVDPLDDALDDAFHGPNGASKQEVKRLVAYQVLRNQEMVAVFNPSLDVTLKGPDDADIDGTFIFTRSKAKSIEQVTPEMVASAYRITASLMRENGEWKFITATYEQITWP
jgi:hypothetical protein